MRGRVHVNTESWLPLARLAHASRGRAHERAEPPQAFRCSCCSPQMHCVAILKIIQRTWHKKNHKKMECNYLREQKYVRTNNIFLVIAYRYTVTSNAPFPTASRSSLSAADGGSECILGEDSTLARRQSIGMLVVGLLWCIGVWTTVSALLVVVRGCCGRRSSAEYLSKMQATRRMCMLLVFFGVIVVIISFSVLNTILCFAKGAHFILYICKTSN